MPRPPVYGPGNTRGKKAFMRAAKAIAQVTAPRHTRHPAKGKIAKVVQSVLNKELETKYTSNQQQNISFNSGISTFLEAYPCLPPVTLTPGDQAARTGYEISPTSAVVNLTVALAPVTRSCAFRVDVYVLTRKANKYWPDVAALGSAVPQLFLTGSPGSTHTTNYTGALAQRYLKPNASEFTVLKHKTFVLGGNVGIPNGDTTAGNAPNLSINGMQKSLALRLKCPKTLKYDQNVTSRIALYPNNYAPFMFIGYSKLDGSTPDVGFQSVLASWTLNLNYKDA